MIKKLNTSTVIIFLISIITFASPLVVNYSDLPKGYEIPKVHFLNISSTILFIVFLFQILSAKIGSEKKVSNRTLFLILIISIFIISTLLSPYQNISLYGNSFRDQGLIFYSICILAGYITLLNITKKNQILLFISIFFSAIIQAIVGVTQYFNLLNKYPDLIDDGYWINGTYGQANFFSTHLVLGFIAGIFLLKFCIKYLNKRILKFTLIVLIGLSLILILLMTILSYSIFGWVTLGVSIALLTLYSFLNRNLFYKVFLGLIAVSSVMTLFILSRTEDNLRIQIWQTSLKVLVNESIENPIRLFFGFGFDTLGNVFKTAKEFQGVLIDRGHNIFIDIIMQTGLAGLSAFLYLLILTSRNLKKIIKDTNLFFLFFLVFIFILKTFIHEYSAVNFYLLVVLIGALLGRILNTGINND